MTTVSAEPRGPLAAARDGRRAARPSWARARHRPGRRARPRARAACAPRPRACAMAFGWHMSAGTPPVDGVRSGPIRTARRPPACGSPAARCRARYDPPHADLRVRLPLLRAPLRGARLELRHARRVPAVHLRRGREAALDVLGAHGRRAPPCARPRAAAVAAGAAAAAAAAATDALSAPDLAAEWAGCTNCALAASRSQVVAGEGPMPAELMLVADAPGFHDDRIGTAARRADRRAARRAARLDRARARATST